MRRTIMNEAGLTARPRRERHMPAFLALAVLLVAGMAWAGMRADSGKKQEGFDPNALPAKVRAALDRAAKAYPQPLRGATWQSFRRLEGTDHALFHLQGRNERGARIEMEITSAGRIIEAEEHGIPMSEVPAAVQAVLKAKMPGFVPEKIEAIWQGEKSQPCAFGFEGDDQRGQKIEVYIDGEGKGVIN